MGTFDAPTQLNELALAEARGADIWLGFGGTDCQILRIGVEVHVSGGWLGHNAHEYKGERCCTISPNLFS